MPIKAGGGSTPDTFRVRLCWWFLPTTSADKGWASKPPPINSVMVDVLGVWSPRKSYFTLHGVLPHDQLPTLNRSSKTLFVKAARSALTENIGVPVQGLTPDVVDWERSDCE